jgi:hemolysin activation/secretion protein
VPNLRGFDAGVAAGDDLVAGSVELRVPLTSPLNAGKLGVSAFVDTGTVYPAGERFRGQPRRTGIGGAVWVSATVVHAILSVAHGRGAGTRVQFGIGTTF